MRGMKLPRFSLRNLFVLVAIASLPMAWSAYQFNWIRQRHEFYDRYNVPHLYSVDTVRECPWSLKLFGEQPQWSLDVPKERMDDAQWLFPEASVMEDTLSHPINAPRDQEELAGKRTN